MTSKLTPLKKIGSAAPFFDEPDIESLGEEVKQILRSKRLVLGPYTKKFEEGFSKYVGTKYGVAVSSATAALEIVLRYCNVKDSEVIVPTNTFVACPNTVLYAGGKPVFADMNPDSFCIDIQDVKRKINAKTKVIMVVHLSGLPEPEMDNLHKICSERGIILMEDCSHAHGATYHGRKVGSLSLAGCFSLFATKIMATGTGGMITTDDPKLSEFAEALRHQGGVGGEGQIEVFDKFGYDWMMSEITAAMGVSQLSKLDKQIEIRRKLADQYHQKLSNMGGVKVPPRFEDKGSKSVYWKFIILLDADVDRDKVRTILRKDYMIDGGILYPSPCHMQPVYQQLGHKQGECPVSEKVMKHQLTLPVNPYMNEEDIEFVAKALEDAISKSRIQAAK